MATDNRCSIKLPYEASGLEFFYLTFTGQYGESHTETIVANPFRADENLFYNSNMMNDAYGWLLDGPRQTITTDDEGAVFTLNSGARLGASQIKNTPYLGQFKISFDINPMELMPGESQAELTLGNVYPGGMMDLNRHEPVSLANSDLGQWKHVEYTLTENGIPPVSPFGFSTDKLAKLKIKNIKLQQ